MRFVPKQNPPSKGLSETYSSTIVSQMVMTLGGSLIPGALGAMLIEILPFLRGIGSDIQHTLGNDNPALIPTVMVAYALTSFLIGIVFVALGAFKAGILVCSRIIIKAHQRGSQYVVRANYHVFSGCLFSKTGPYRGDRWYWSFAVHSRAGSSSANVVPRSYPHVRRVCTLWPAPSWLALCFLRSSILSVIFSAF